MNGLVGKRILITRAKAQAAELVVALTGLDAIPILFPTIEIAPLEDPSHLDGAIAALKSYAWVIFTSVNGVAAFWQRLQSQGLSSGVFTGLRVAAIGPATAQALRERGVTPAWVPQEYVAEAILPGLGEVRGQKILLPRAEIARPALVAALERQGGLPDEIPVYRTLAPRPDRGALRELERGVDIATFTSSSTVRNFFEILGDRAQGLLAGALIACIGPITAETARGLGLGVDILAEEYTVAGLVAAMVAYYRLRSMKDRI